MSEGSHPFPSRTRKLSPPEPMVLRGKPRGRVGRCRIFLKAPSPHTRVDSGPSPLRATDRRLMLAEREARSSPPLQLLHRWHRLVPLCSLGQARQLEQMNLAGSPQQGAGQYIPSEEPVQPSRYALQRLQSPARRPMERDALPGRADGCVRRHRTFPAPIGRHGRLGGGFPLHPVDAVSDDEAHAASTPTSS
jgi:hypothetical protein